MFYFNYYKYSSLKNFCQAFCKNIFIETGYRQVAIFLWFRAGVWPVLRMKENADRFDLKQRMVKIIIKTGIKPAATLYAAGLKTIYQWY